MLDILLNKISISISRAKKNIEFNSIKYSGLIKSAGAMFVVLYGPQALNANTSFSSTNKAQTEQNEALPTSFNPDNPEYNIEGSVLNTNQQPISNIPLYLINFQNGVAADTLAQAVSSMSGEFEFVNLANSINPPTPIPTNFRVSENYPNPVRTNTTLDLEIVTPGNYTLTKVNTLGQVVSRTTFSHVPSGVHQINMDVRGLASGAYFYKITGPDEQRTGSMVVINNNIVGGSSPGVVLNQGAGDKNNIEDIMNMSGVRSYSEDFDLRITTPKTSEYEASETPVNTGSSLQIVNITLESLAQLYALSGQVKNADDEVLVGKELKIKDSDDSVIASVFTDENGLYSFEFETSDTNLSLKKPETEFYEEQRIPLNLQQGENTLDITALDKFVLSMIQGNVFNARDEGVQGVSVTNEYGSATTNSQGDYALQLEHEKRKQAQPTTLMFSHPNYNSKQKEASLQNQTLNALLDIILQENNFVLNVTDVNGDPISGASLLIGYLNETGTDSVFVDVTPNSGQTQSQVNFANWPGEDFTMQVDSENYLKTIIGRFVNQSFDQKNMFQNKYLDEEKTTIPNQTINNEGEANVYLIPRQMTRTVISQGEPIQQTVDMDWLLHETVTAINFPFGSTKWYTDDLKVAVLAWPLTSPGYPVPEDKVQEMYDITEDIMSSYTLNNGKQLQTFDLRIVESEDDPWYQESADPLFDMVRVWRAQTPVPGNNKQYQQIGQDWYLRSANAFFSNGVGANSIIEEIFEAFSASDEPSNANRWYISRYSSDNPSSFNDIGRVLLRSITLSDPQKLLLNNSQTNSTYSSNKLENDKVEDAVILEEVEYK